MTETTTGQGKWQLWLIVILTAAVLLGGFLIFPGSEEERSRLLNLLGTSNRGELLQPTVPIIGLAASNAGGDWSWSALKPKWRLVLPVVGVCDAACMELLYVSRQVHVRLDKNAHRLQRLLLNLGAPLDVQTQEFLAREHAFLEQITAVEADFAQLLVNTNADWNSERPRLFLVDQRGELMMYYTPQHDGADLLADLRHLLKYSPEP